MLHARHATTACSMVIALVLSGIAQQGGRRNLSRADSASNDLPTIIELTPKSSDTAARAPSPAKPEADSAASALPTQPAVEPEEPVAAHTETPPGRLPDFSLFDYRKVISVGPWLSYFYYNENIDVSQMVQWYRDQYGTSPVVVGTPKSSEYGAVVGVRLQMPHYLRKPNLFIRPQVALLLGLNNTYDGSSAGAYDSGSTGAVLEFTPVVMQKSNIFLFGSCDIGYTFSPARWSCVAYTGLDGKLWIRDMTQSSTSPDESGSSVSSSETYYWLSVPLGAIIAHPISSRTVLGIEPRIEFMFFGQMQIEQSDASSSITYDYPAVTLGNRVSYRLETFLQVRVNERTSLTFALFGLLYGFGKSNTDSATISDGFTSIKAAFLEPSSQSFQIGFTLNVGFLRKRYSDFLNKY